MGGLTLVDETTEANWALMSLSRAGDLDTVADQVALNLTLGQREMRDRQPVFESSLTLNGEELVEAHGETLRSFVRHETPHQGRQLSRVSTLFGQDRTLRQVALVSAHDPDQPVSVGEPRSYIYLFTRAAHDPLSVTRLSIEAPPEPQHLRTLLTTLGLSSNVLGQDGRKDVYQLSTIRHENVITLSDLSKAYSTLSASAPHHDLSNRIQRYVASRDQVLGSIATEVRVLKQSIVRESAAATDLASGLRAAVSRAVLNVNATIPAGSARAREWYLHEKGLKELPHESPAPSTVRAISTTIYSRNSRPALAAVSVRGWGALARVSVKGEVTSRNSGRVHEKKNMPVASRIAVPQSSTGSPAGPHELRSGAREQHIRNAEARVLHPPSRAKTKGQLPVESYPAASSPAPLRPVHQSRSLLPEKIPPIVDSHLEIPPRRRTSEPSIQPSRPVRRSPSEPATPASRPQRGSLPVSRIHTTHHRQNPPEDTTVVRSARKRTDFERSTTRAKLRSFPLRSKAASHETKSAGTRFAGTIRGVKARSQENPGARNVLLKGVPSTRRLIPSGLTRGTPLQLGRTLIRQAQQRSIRMVARARSILTRGNRRSGIRLKSSASYAGDHRGSPLRTTLNKWQTAARRLASHALSYLRRIRLLGTGNALNPLGRRFAEHRRPILKRETRLIKVLWRLSAGGIRALYPAALPTPMIRSNALRSRRGRRALSPRASIWVISRRQIPLIMRPLLYLLGLLQEEQQFTGLQLQASYGAHGIKLSGKRRDVKKRGHLSPR